MGKATVGDLEERVGKLERAFDIACYVRKQYEAQTGILARALARHLKAESLVDEDVSRAIEEIGKLQGNQHGG